MAAGRADVAAPAVVHGVMLEAERRQIPVAAKLIRVDGRAGSYILDDLGQEIVLAVAGNHGRQNVPVALQHAHDERLVRALTAALAAPTPEGEAPADPCLVNLDNLALAADRL